MDRGNRVQGARNLRCGGRACTLALLRDMINWCIQHPVRGKPLASDDPKMRALEAYILAQRKGKPLDYGRH